MKVLETQDYQRIFFKAILYNSIEKVAGYFTGKFNEVKESNPEVLFIDGLENAYNAFEQQFKREYFEQKNEYFQLIQLNPANKAEIEEPDINNHGFPSNYIDRDLYGHYHYRDIVRINEGLNIFKNSLIKTDNPKNKPLPQLSTNLTNDQRSKLFDLLINGEFIPHSTDRKSFEWVFGSNQQPNNWQPIEWKKNKQLLREIIEAKEIMTFKIKGEKAKMEKKVPLLFIKDGQPCILAKNKPKPDCDSDSIIEILKELATNINY